MCNVAVLCGGDSLEAEVSRVTGRCVAEALGETYGQVHLLELDDQISYKLKELSIDVVFPALHGSIGENGAFQGFMELLGIPYVGSGLLASGLAMDKVMAKILFASVGLPLAKQIVLTADTVKEDALEETIDQLGPSVVIKPASQGSALGVFYASSMSELARALNEAFSFDEKLLVEERIFGKEVTVGILEGHEDPVLPVIEIVTPEGEWYDYEHRYTEGLSEHIIPARLTEEQIAKAKSVALRAHRVLGCRDLSRADFVVPEKGEPILLEVNTLPGMTPTSLYPDGAQAAGFSFPSLLAHLVQRALARGKLPKKGRAVANIRS